MHKYIAIAREKYGVHEFALYVDATSLGNAYIEAYAWAQKSELILDSVNAIVPADEIEV